MQKVLFRRAFRNFTGGHLKVWDYFNHVNAAPGYSTGIYFTPESVWDATNPWLALRAEVESRWEPAAADVLFLGGQDWLQLPREERRHYRRPVINLIQHVHHGDPAHPFSAFLEHRAIRVCVSAEVQAAIQATSRVNGPTIIIPNGIDLAGENSPPAAGRTVDWLICGMKTGQSAVARELARRLATAYPRDTIELLTKLLPRTDFLAKVAQARRAVLLPRATEGFYLPALEAMALGALVICPDCLGNRSFCQDGTNAVVPASAAAADLWQALQRARSLPHPEEAAILAQARAIAAQHSLANERAACHELLAAIPSLW